MSAVETSFSGGVRLADVSDFIAPSQACVVAVGTPELPGKDEAKAKTGEVSLQSRARRGQAKANPKGAKPGGSKAGEDPVKISLNDCLACSGCVTSAETVLLEQQSTEEFLRVLEAKAESDRVVVVTISQASRTSLASHYGLSPLEMTMRLTGFLKSLGADFVLEDNTGRDVALLATLEEFWDKYTSGRGGVGQGFSLPLLTSECPGWVLYAEKTHGEVVLPYMSKARSAIATLGSLTKKLLPSKLGVDAGSIYHCFISPCFDKKLEALREDLKSGEFADLDCVLATTEFHNLLKMKSFAEQTCPALPFDDILQGPGTQQAQFSNFGSSGGYLEFVFRECVGRLRGQAVFEPDKPLPLKVIRNQDFQEISLQGEDGRVILHFALAYGFRNIQNIIRRIKQKKMTYHFVEIMACPSGCLNGGGQMKDDDQVDEMGRRVIDRKEILRQLEQLYHDSEVARRHPRGNPNTSQIEEWLGGFKTPKANEVLYTEFHDRSQKKNEAPTPMMLDF
ncbi:cytosolic Fe-S cluster assembly factor NARFL [Chloropicon primus]|uniref:Cytosolic Fe-S cluster assembly factor NARFL n=1 Tax=Chloropicon primus TaxID=1764295 RepID=A0A5B8MJZ0_9CHLO|nr:cytosolic Fe-S cluster assembly factor NARFL [Chloropicon primus]UPQ99931.1 cytosolic Fe-S cluster assembly factor NARFL [Chloropicon primus]|eukprot:QDZ20719.1 cytosolic Fe-S cluster assembly factor NARFL [Chloropicon primus]